MKHCQNPACPHARAVGTAAEFVDDRATCSDCGATLEDGPAPEKPTARDAIPRSLWGRLAITVGAVVALRLLERIALPGIDVGGIAHLYPERTSSDIAVANFSVVALGIMPLLSAAVLVQVAALIVPRWRSLRWSQAGRARLQRAMLIVTLALGLFQGYALGQFLQSTPMVGDEASVPIICLTTTAGTFLLILLGGFVSRRGLGNGLATLLFLTTTPGVLRPIRERLTWNSGSTTAQQMVALGVPTLFVFASAYALTNHIRSRKARQIAPDPDIAQRYREAPDQALSPMIRAPASGVIPMAFVASLLTLISTIGVLGVRTGNLYAAILKMGDEIHIALAIGVAVLATILFHPLDRLTTRWSRGLRRRKERDEIHDELRRERIRAALWSAGFTGILLLVSSLASPSIGAVTSAASVAILTAIAMDFRDEWRARRAGGDLVIVWSEDDVGAADAVSSALEAESIPVLARGVHLRTMLQVMGPYVPIELMVPASRETEAAELLRARFPKG